MCRLGANTIKRKDGRYEVRFRIGRKPNGTYEYLYGFGRTLTVAKEKLRIKIEKYESSKAEIENTGSKFRFVVAGWLRNAETFRKKSTAAKYHDYCNCYILPALGDMNIGDISNRDLKNFCADLARTSNDSYGLSNNTILPIMRIMGMIKKYAEDNGYKVKFMPDRLDIKAKRNNIQVLDKFEQLRLCNYIDKHLSPMNLGIYLALKTGIRIGELCGLKWNDISLVDKKMNICRTLQRIRNNGEDVNKTQIVTDAPKSDSSRRTIPLSDCVCDRLADFYEPDSYFLAEEKGEIVEPRKVQYHFKKVLKECGIKSVNFHTLRHTFATNSVAAGVDIKCLSELLGHSNVHITLGFYVHPTMEMKRESMEKIEQ